MDSSTRPVLSMEYLLSEKHLSKCKNLTDREMDIIYLIWQGYKMTTISYMLDISHRTVEFHRYNIMKKFRVKNTVQLLRVALAKDIISIGVIA